MPYDDALTANGTFVGISVGGELESEETLLFDHERIVATAARSIRERYEELPDPDGLLDDFTLAELRSLHEAVLGERLLKDTFKRRMFEHLVAVERDGEPTTRSGGGRPAQVYERSPSSDLATSASARRRLRLPRGEE